MNLKLKKQINNVSIIKKFISFGVWVIAIVYILALLKIVLFKYGFTSELRSLNLKPFAFIESYFTEDVTIDVALKNVAGNFALFIPLGILLPALFKNINKKKTVFICFGVSLLFEFLQYIIGLGASDIDDVVLNTFGGIIGMFIYFKILKRIDIKIKMRIATFSFLSVFGLCGLLSLYLYQPNILPAQVEVINQEILEGVDAYSADIQTVCIDVDNDSILIDKSRRFYDDNYKVQSNEDKYIIDNNTKLFLQLRKYKYSPNGNIQKSTFIYNKITMDEFKNLIKKEEKSVNLWISEDNKCSRVLVVEKGDME
ncbi:VanZ family protein [Clostridium senegalense]|uniref:VanZ family protein n=1 Tax=Clostridium senegalense TaxID=1465809 RepID=UPI001C11B14A|nr:VanZ family protein [Clostridium senegalense]MBU5225153.1 VanZ family protein [Clostridium senegalense]